MATTDPALQSRFLHLVEATSASTPDKMAVFNTREGGGSELRPALVDL